MLRRGYHDKSTCCHEEQTWDRCPFASDGDSSSFRVSSFQNPCLCYSPPLLPYGFRFRLVRSAEARLAVSPQSFQY